MILSRCCKSSVHAYSTNEGTSFYICDVCSRACDTICHSHEFLKEDDDDTGHVGET